MNEIKRAYKIKSLQLHPDKTGKTQFDEFATLNKCYKYLSKLCWKHSVQDVNELLSEIHLERGQGPQGPVGKKKINFKKKLKDTSIDIIGRNDTSELLPYCDTEGFTSIVEDGKFMVITPTVTNVYDMDLKLIGDDSVASKPVDLSNFSISNYQQNRKEILTHHDRLTRNEFMDRQQVMERNYTSRLEQDRMFNQRLIQDNLARMSVEARARLNDYKRIE